MDEADPSATPPVSAQQTLQPLALDVSPSATPSSPQAQTGGARVILLIVLVAVGMVFVFGLLQYQMNRRSSTAGECSYAAMPDHPVPAMKLRAEKLRGVLGF
ncbi:hypothetical protein FVE85_9105 [Porphyridium purpureum]|uniref:Uncharacterized protein n=1 Tax=Porphyridium purpureum TaxID=35688 RepID=A0A5J4YQ17_PORPP|nr:hypothetical protein FVE85_9105 [Porphyridium purpureum]|eukprot:POR0896..scf222_8